MGRVRRVASALTLGATAALVAGVPAASAHHPPAPPPGDIAVVASGLDNPRGIDLAGGTLYVAESGRGGAGPCGTSPEGTQVCLGATGAVTAVDLAHGTQARILSALPSVAGAGGTQAIGPSDVSMGRKGLYLTIGLGAPPEARATFGPGGALLGTLKVLGSDGQLRFVADLAAFEAANDPDHASGGVPDSNPNSVDAKGRGLLVADAGGNDIVKVKHGALSVFSLLPFGTAPFPEGIPDGPPAGTPVPVQPVPTSVVRAPHGTAFVGQLTGFPFPLGGASIWRVPKGGGAPEKVAGGFSYITDLALGRDGSIYVTQFASRPFLGPPSPGALIRLKPDGTREELAAGRLTSPMGVVLGKGVAYVTNHGAEPGTGEVLRIPLGG